MTNKASSKKRPSTSSFRLSKSRNQARKAQSSFGFSGKKQEQESTRAPDKNQNTKSVIILLRPLNPHHVHVLQHKFPKGVRVKVPLESLEPDENRPNNQLVPFPSSSQSLSSPSCTAIVPVFTPFGPVIFGSVVDWDFGIVVVHLDGQLETTRVAADLCTRIDDDESNVWSNGTVRNSPNHKKKKARRRHLADLSWNEQMSDPATNESCLSLSLVPKRHKPFQPAATIEEALKAGGWTLRRSKNHLVYERQVVEDDGRVHEIGLTMPKTPSDRRRGEKNSLARINRLNRKYGTADKFLIEHRHCVGCGEYKPQGSFSTKQWKKTRSKCKTCTLSTS